MQEQGIYKATDRYKELYSPVPFTNNLLIWLATLSFSVFIASTLFPFAWRWGKMLAELTPLQWTAFILGGIFILAFIIASLWSLVSVLILVIRGFRGVKIRPDSEKIDDNIREAMKARAIHDLGKELGLAIKRNNELIARNNELIAKYVEVIDSKQEEESQERKGKSNNANK